MPQSTVTEMPSAGPHPQGIGFDPLSNWWIELVEDEAPTIFDCLLDVAGEIARLIRRHGRTEAGAA